MKYNKEIPKNSSLLPFKPFMHESLIRVGGRIKHADLPFNIKHQIIIHHKHRIASLILRDIHERYMLTGRHHILSLSREHYRISKGCSLARKIVSSCFTCKRRVVKPAAPLMADLSTERLSIKQNHSHIPASITLVRSTLNFRKELEVIKRLQRGMELSLHV